jgi:hypothetical protein
MPTRKNYVMHPFGCRTAYELTQLRSWDKNLPSRILGALLKPKWLRLLQRRGPSPLDPAVAAGCGQEPGDPESVAVDVGG